MTFKSENIFQIFVQHSNSGLKHLTFQLSIVSKSETVIYMSMQTPYLQIKARCTEQTFIALIF